jgi:hypothetical protein
VLQLGVSCTGAAQLDMGPGSKQQQVIYVGDCSCTAPCSTVLELCVFCTRAAEHGQLAAITSAGWLSRAVQLTFG